MLLGLQINYDLITTLIKLLFTTIAFYLPLLNICKLEVGKTKLLVITFLTEIILVIVYVLFRREIASSFIAFLLMIAFVYTLKKNILISIINVSITIILILTLQNGIGALVAYLFRISADAMRANVWIYWLTYFLTFSTASFITKKLGNVFESFISSTPPTLKPKVNISIACFFILTSVMFILNVFLVTDETNNIFLSVINSFLLIVDLMLIVFITFYFIRFMRQELELKHNQELLQNLKSYIISVENIQFEMHNYRHDIVNILFSMHNYMENDDMPGLKNFFDKNIHPIRQKTSAYGTLLKQLENIRILELNGILTIKLISAIECNINVHVEVCDSIDSLDIESIDLVRIVGSLLDNAIEECKKGEGMLLQFAVVKNPKSIKFIFINQLMDSTPDISKIYEKGYSTKGEKRGIGLFSVRKILSKYGHIGFKTEIISEDAVDKISLEIIFPLNENGCDV